MKQLVFILFLLTCTSLQAQDKKVEVKPQPIKTETARVYKFKNSRVKRALRFTTKQKTKLC
jgi:hypothetical protein